MKYALRTLKWVLHAKRPLSPQEILRATALELNPESSVAPRRPQPASSYEYLIRVCGNFIALDNETNSFRFIHYSVQEFLKEIPDLSNDDTLANSCFTILGATTNEHKEQNLDIYGYAAHHWEEHCKSWTAITNYRGMLIKGFLLNSAAFANWQQHRDLHQGSRSAGYYRLSSYFNLPFILEYLLQLDQHQSHQPELAAALIIAADRGFLQVVGHILGAGANPNSRGGWCGTPLQAASYRGFGGVVELLLDANADIDAIDGHYGSALNAAIATESELVIQQLLDAGANSNSCGVDGPVLRAAVLKGSKRMVEMLLAAGADVNFQSNEFFSALYTATRLNNANLFQLLMDSGADVNALSGKHRGSALYIAAGKGVSQLVKQLLAAKADPNIQGGKYGSPLYYAVRGGHPEVVKLLLDSGADVNYSICRRGCHDALCAAVETRSAVCVEILINAKANLQPTKYGSPLYTAILRGYDELVAKLLDCGADPNAHHPDSPPGDEFPLLIASKRGFHEIVKLLIGAGARINCPSRYTALGLATAESSHSTVKVLLAAGVNPNNGGIRGCPLEVAVLKGSEDIVKCLLDAGADVNLVNSTRQSILLKAVNSGNLRLVELILKADPDVDYQSTSQPPALLRAVQRGSLEIVDALLSAGAKVRNWETKLPSDCALHDSFGTGDHDLILVLLMAGAHSGGVRSEPRVAVYPPPPQFSLDILELLLEAKADVNTRGAEFGFALQLVAATGCPPTMELLLQAGAEVNAIGGEIW